MRVCVLLSFLLLFILLVSFCSVLPAHAALTWNIQTVDKDSSGGGIIALDSNNNPYIAYSDYENGYYQNTVYLMYASLNRSTWNTQIVTPNAWAIDLKIDAHNNPHVLLLGNINEIPALMYASWTGVNWTIQTLPFQGSCGSLALDSAGNPHVAYLGGNGDLKYASWTGSSWSIQTVDSGNNSGAYLALDSNNNPYILYGGNYTIIKNGYASSTSVKYAVWNGSAWSIQTVVSNIIDGYYGNLVLDSNGYPHFTYYKGETLTYDSWTGSAWKTQTVASNFNSEDAGYLALDSHNNPHVAYYKETYGDYEGTLLYATWTGKAWATQTVDPNNASEDRAPYQTIIWY